MEEIEYNSYIYKHIDEQGIPFYVGIGHQSSIELKNNTYYRANDKTLRNNFWKRIVSKNPNYIVEIIIDQIPWNDALINEIKLIKFYGRRDLNEGTLCNLTDGGEGTLGYVVLEEAKKKMSKIHKGKKISNSHKKILSNLFSIPTLQYDLNGNFIKEWKSQTEAAKFYNLESNNISNVCRNIKKSAANYQWRYKIDNYSLKIEPCIHLDLKPVIKYDLSNNKINEYPTIKSAADSINVNISSVSRVCRGLQKTSKGYIFKFKK
jgi:hypothetical protein